MAGIKAEDLTRLYDNRAIHTIGWDGRACPPVETNCTISGSISLTNIDISLRRIANSLENGEKLKQRDETLGKAEEEIKRLADELGDARVALSKMEGKAAHFEAARKREVAELSECLNEAVRLHCDNLDGDCLHCIRCGVCNYLKWRKALEGANDER